MMGSRSSILSLRTAAASAGVLVAAVTMGLVAPGAAAFLTAEVPRAYVVLRSWLTPPYLYFVINGIIISIAASSRFQKAAPAGSTAPAVSTAIARPEFVAAVEYAAKVEVEEARPSLLDLVEFEVKAVEKAEAQPEFVDPAVYGGEEEEAENTAAAREALEEEFVISRSSWSPKRRESRETPTEFFAAAPEKPLVSSRFGQHRRTAKPSPDGKALRVARPKRGETLEGTWKAITDGRAVPLTRHLKKSDTWADAHGRGRQEVEAPPMRKSETFHDRAGRPPASISPSPGGGKIRRDPSLGQDELNRRVEAFINKFNEEMRLQRQESFQHYLDMIDRGSH